MKNAAAFVLGVLILLAAGAGLYWRFALRPYYLVNSARHAHMARLGEAVAEFNARQNRLPKSLDELVAAGLLPEKTELCWSPVKHQSMTARPVSYKECEYDVSFTPKAVVISIPSASVPGRGFSFLDENKRSFTVTAGVRAYHP